MEEEVGGERRSNVGPKKKFTMNMTLLSSYEVSTSTLSELSVWLSQKASNAAVKKGKGKRKRKRKYSWLVFS